MNIAINQMDASSKSANQSAVRGLLVYLFYSVRGSFSIIVLLTIVMATALIITGSQLVFTIFSGIGLIGPSYVILMKMGGGSYGKWERFQLTLPIRRGDLVLSQYLGILLGTLVSIPVVLVLTSIAFILHEPIFGTNLVSVFLGLSSVLAVPFIMIGLLFPLSCTSWGADKQEGLAFVCFLVAFAIPVLISGFGMRSGLSSEVSAVISLVVAQIIFLVSYVLTKRLYDNIDF